MSDWKTPFKQALAVGGVLAAVLAALTAFRWGYYGELLPNTYFAKTGGFAAPRGLVYLQHHVLTHGVLWALVALR